MLCMQPIREAAVVAQLNGGRFEGDVEGYVVMEEQTYHGYALYRVEGEEATLLEASLSEPLLVDGAVRACLSASQRRGATVFWVNQGCPPLAAWWQAQGEGRPLPSPIAALWGGCTA